MGEAMDSAVLDYLKMGDRVRDVVTGCEYLVTTTGGPELHLINLETGRHAGKAPKVRGQLIVRASDLLGDTRRYSLTRRVGSAAVHPRAEED